MTFLASKSFWSTVTRWETQRETVFKSVKKSGQLRAERTCSPHKKNTNFAILKEITFLAENEAQKKEIGLTNRAIMKYFECSVFYKIL